MNESPDQQLKEKIIEALKKNGILSGNNLKKLENNYTSKGLSEEDWILLVEDQIHDEEGNNGQ